MFNHFSTDELEVAPLRARLRWADAIDEALAAPTPQIGAPALRRVRDVLRDADVAVSRDDLRRLRTFLRATAEASPADGDAARRGALDLVGAFPVATAADGRRCVTA